MTNAPAHTAATAARKHFVPLMVSLVIVTLVLIVTASWLFISHRYSSPVPKNIRKAINFAIYYPDQAKLPQGYNLDTASFKSPSSEAVLYTVIYDSGKKLIFTVQHKPTPDELDNFNKQVIPIHRQVSVPLGTATEGAIGKQTVVSLPVDNDKSWVLMTGPANIYNTDHLTQVLKSLRQ